MSQRQRPKRINEVKQEVMLSYILSVLFTSLNLVVVGGIEHNKMKIQCSKSSSLYYYYKINYYYY